MGQVQLLKRRLAAFLQQTKTASPNEFRTRKLNPKRRNTAALNLISLKAHNP